MHNWKKTYIKIFWNMEVILWQMEVSEVNTPTLLSHDM